MGTPSKRRKKNDHQSSNQPVRGLDFFFGKQQAAQAAQTNGAGTSTTDPANDGNAQGIVEAERPLTDEEYALKLQAEFDEQDRLLAANHTEGARDNDEEEKPSDGRHVEENGDKSLEVDDGVEKEVKEEHPPAEDIKAISWTIPTINPFAAFGKKNTLSLQTATAEEDTISYTIPFDESPMTFDPRNTFQICRSNGRQKVAGSHMPCSLRDSFSSTARSLASRL